MRRIIEFHGNARLAILIKCELVHKGIRLLASAVFMRSEWGDKGCPSSLTSMRMWECVDLWLQNRDKMGFWQPCLNGNVGMFEFWFQKLFYFTAILMFFTRWRKLVTACDKWWRTFTLKNIQLLTRNHKCVTTRYDRVWVLLDIIAHKLLELKANRSPVSFQHIRIHGRASTITGHDVRSVRHWLILFWDDFRFKYRTLPETANQWADFKYYE